MSIVYKDILGKLRDIGLTTTKLRSEKLLSESTLSKIRRNENTSINNLDIICNLLHCQPSDILEIRYDTNYEKPDYGKNPDTEDEDF